MDELFNATKFGEKAAVYQEGTRDGEIRVAVVNRTIDGVVPAVALGGSIETDSDDIIHQELMDRLQSAGVAMDDCPSFEIAMTYISTSDRRDSMWTKCVMTQRAGHQEIHEAFNKITTPGSRARYLVTRDYYFTSILYPATMRSDQSMRAAIQRQNKFIQSICKTTLFGISEADPFYVTPAETYEAGLERKIKNMKTIAEIILLDKVREANRRQADSPVIRVSTNRGNTKIFLAAMRKDAAELVWYTMELVRNAREWYEGDKVLYDVEDAACIGDKQGGGTQRDDGDESKGTIGERFRQGGDERDEGERTQIMREFEEQRTTLAEVHCWMQEWSVKNERGKASDAIAKSIAGTRETMVESSSRLTVQAVSKCSDSIEEQRQRSVAANSGNAFFPELHE